jgi:hypothetical protein
MRWSLPLVLSLSLLPAAPARAQESVPLPSRTVVLPPSPDQLNAAERSDLDAWLDGMHKWQQMDKRWHNEPGHDVFGRIVQRRPMPPPPAWLEARCGTLPREFVKTLDGALGNGCRLMAGVDADPTADAIRATTIAARASAEKLEKNSFLTRIHIDGLWTSTSSDVRIYGLVGSHISLVDVGRVQFFGPPGVILLSVPDSTGSRRIRAGYTWGMSVRLGEVRLFAPSKNMTLFLTLSKVWVPGGSAMERLQPGGFDIAGFSLAPRKHTR